MVTEPGRSSPQATVLPKSISCSADSGNNTHGDATSVPQNQGGTTESMFHQASPVSNTSVHQDAGLAAARQTLPLQLNGKVGLPPKSLIVVT